MSVIIITLLSAIGTALVYLLTPLVQASVWNLFWIPCFFLGYFLAVSFLYWLFSFLIALFVNKNKEHHSVNRLYFYNIIGLARYAFLLVLGVRIRKRNFSKLPHKPCLYIYNHTSIVDPVLIMSSVHHRGVMTFVAKKESRNYPFLGQYMAAIGTIFLDRESIEDGVKMVRSSSDYIHNQHVSVAIAPEGTRSLDGHLLPFHNGTFQIAKEAECPIVLMGISGGMQFHTKSLFHRKKIELNVLEVIYPENYSEMSNGEISSHSFELFQEFLKSA